MMDANIAKQIEEKLTLCSANDKLALYRYKTSANDKSALYRYRTASIDYSRMCNRKRISEKSRSLEIQYCRRSCSANEKSPLYHYKTASIDYSRICNRKTISETSRRLEINTIAEGGQEGRREARQTGNMCPGMELTDEGMYGLCLPSQVPKEMIWYMSENCQDAGSKRMF
ncbi:hypothetical protein ANN_26525 [Periplaneta americana]|uniref:Uncharacterized protein n=1 Tax=Periplaneta americana TaxID=6978 RepID=A0ABQ8RZ08_PERAM|nr:hypothetical protein ANN_26525 [Periplaneta americana]